MMLAGTVVAALLAAGNGPTTTRKCTQENPCTLVFIEGARQRVAHEKEMAARLAGAPADEHNRNVADRYMDLLKEQILGEREFFGKWCAITNDLRNELKKQGATVTSEQLFAETGQPDEESRLAQGSVEGKTWTWHASGPLSGDVAFGILFVRAAGSKDAWEFAGCTWCASGNAAVPRSCVDLPWKP